MPSNLHRCMQDCSFLSMLWDEWMKTFFISLLIYVLLGSNISNPKVFVLMGNHQFLLFLKYEAHASIFFFFFLMMNLILHVEFLFNVWVVHWMFVF
jgi:hypothetical protein